MRPPAQAMHSLHPDLADQALGETSPLPSLSISEIWRQYDVWWSYSAAGYFSVLHLKKTLELLQSLWAWEALEAFYRSMSIRIRLAKTIWLQGQGIHYQELEGTQAQKVTKPFRKLLTKNLVWIFVMDSYQALQSANSATLEFLGDKDPMVIGLPIILLTIHLLFWTIQNSNQSLIEDCQYLDQSTVTWRSKNIHGDGHQYCALAGKDVASYQSSLIA